MARDPIYNCLSPERCPRGRRGRPAKALCGLKPASRVRIPLSPPLHTIARPQDCGGSTPRIHPAGYWGVIRRRLAGFLAVLAIGVGMSAEASDPAAHIASFAQLEAAGATIGTIRVHPQNIFDLADPSENNSFFRTVNKLHIGTRAGVIEQVLLFKSGE